MNKKPLPDDKTAKWPSGILVTGGLGFLGSHAATALVQEGFHIYLLARSQNGVSADKRLQLLLDWLGVGAEEKTRFHLFQGDLDHPGFGLDADTRHVLVNAVEEILHCASDTSFSERRRPRIEKTNVANLDHLLDFAEASRCRLFHHVSTAFVAGKQTGPCPESFRRTDAFINVYEKTKYQAERRLIERCTALNLPLNIYRPSIVYGHSQTGRALRFNALYYPMRTLAFFKNVYERDIIEGDGLKAGAMGVKLDGRDRLHMPIRLDAAGGAGLNLIPVDFFAQAFIILRKQAGRGNGIFHIVNSKQTDVEDLVAFANRFFRIDGFRVVSSEAFDKRPRNGLESLFDKCVETYRPYMKESRTFRDDKTRACLNDHRIVCPDLDYDTFSSCMQYAVQTDWGLKLFHAEA